MSYVDRFAIFLDGGFLRKRLGWVYKRKPSANDIVQYCSALIKSEQFIGSELFRIYYYDAPPFSSEKKHILTGEPINFSEDPRTLDSQALLDSLKLKKNFAVRLGNTTFRGWKLVDDVKHKLSKYHSTPDHDGKFKLSKEDFAPDIVQKGVDMKIGLDIASIASKRIVQKIVITSGDTDMIPAMKLARKEGLRVYIDFIGQPNNDLIEHSDEIVNPIPRDEIEKRKNEDKKRRKK